MKLPDSVYRRLAWLNLPAGILVVLLQRTPALRVLASAGDYVLASPAGHLLRAALAGTMLGATHSLAGATTFVQSPGNPIQGTVGTPVQAGFTYTGTPSSPERFQINSGALPPGLNFIPAPIGSNIPAGDVAISGTPTQAGSFTVFVQGFNGQGLTNGVSQPITFEISGGATATAPSITAPPTNQTVNTGGSATFSVQASGTTPFTYQWRKNGTNISSATSASLTINNVQAADAGQYSVVVSNSAGSDTSSAATLTVNATSALPTITAHPVAQTIASGSTVVFSASSTGATSHQWHKDNSALSGAASATLVIRNVTAAHAGAYKYVGTNGSGSAASNTATLSVVSTTTGFGRLVNLSINTSVSTADPSFIVGTVIGGDGTSGDKTVLVRAVGPRLGMAPFNVGGVLSDPKMDFFSGQTIISSNDDWGGGSNMSTVFDQLGAFPLAGSTKDAAVLIPLSGGAYTVQVAGVGGATGVVLAELYDSTPNNSFTPATRRLVNVSVRKKIDPGTKLTAGFVVDGQTAKTVLVRAIGPTLGLPPFNVPGVMPDPQLSLFRGETKIAENDNWGGDIQLMNVGDSVGAFGVHDGNSKDAILLITLAPAAYTVEVTGVAAGGEAIVEVYEVP